MPGIRRQPLPYWASVLMGNRGSEPLLDSLLAIFYSLRKHGLSINDDDGTTAMRETKRRLRLRLLVAMPSGQCTWGPTVCLASPANCAKLLSALAVLAALLALILPHIGATR